MAPRSVRLLVGAIPVGTLRCVYTLTTYYSLFHVVRPSHPTRRCCLPYAGHARHLTFATHHPAPPHPTPPQVTIEAPLGESTLPFRKHLTPSDCSAKSAMRHSRHRCARSAARSRGHSDSGSASDKATDQNTGDSEWATDHELSVLSRA